MIRIGCGTGYLDDRLDSALAMAENAAVDFLAFEGLAEATLAGMHARADQRAGIGYGAALIDGVREALERTPDGHRLRVVTSLGGIDVAGASAAMADATARLPGPVRVARVEGDDVTDYVVDKLAAGGTFPHLVDGTPFPVSAGDVIGANVYLGAAPITEALGAGADVVVCGRVTDTAMYLAPVLHSYPEWRQDNRLLAIGVVVGHLLECAGHVCGGNYFGPEWPRIDFERLGHGLAEVAPDGDVVITKLVSEGGMVSRRTCAEQLLYEIHDPGAFLTPDVTVDLTQADLTEIGPDRVRVTGITGRPAPATLKVLIAYRNGYLVEGQASYGAPQAVAKVRRASEILMHRITRHHGITPLRSEMSIIGVNSLYPPIEPRIELPEARMRLVVHLATRSEADVVSREMGSLYDCGPPGAADIAGPTAGSQTLASEIVAVWPALIPRGRVKASIAFEK